MKLPGRLDHHHHPISSAIIEHADGLPQPQRNWAILTIALGLCGGASNFFRRTKSVKAGAPGMVPGGACRELEDGQMSDYKLLIDGKLASGAMGLQKEVAGSERSPFYIDELVRGRRTKRGFTNKAVPIDLVRDILSISKFAPSSSNTQPWQCYVLTGKARERVVAAAVKAFNDNPKGLIPEYPFFPDPLHEPHLETFTKYRGQLGDAQGVERSDKVGRRRDVARQFMFFDAPVGLIFTMDRLLVPASFICYGAFLQTIMLAAQGRGLDTCPQQIWSLQYPILRKELGIPESDMVVAGMCLGYADNSLPENNMILEKFEPEKFARFIDL